MAVPILPYFPREAPSWAVTQFGFFVAALSQAPKTPVGSRRGRPLQLVGSWGAKKARGWKSTNGAYPGYLSDGEKCSCTTRHRPWRFS